MQCPQCQHETPADFEFCSTCGVRLVRVCTSCGASAGVADRFCNKCGHPLTAMVQEPSARLVVSPYVYTPRHLGEKILRSRTALEGERKHVTVLFADLKASLELLADRDPEEARRLLDPVLERMIEAVHHYDGMTNQVMGDGIMALFGAPVAHEDHAIRACYAALRMQEAVKRCAVDLGQSEGTPIQIRVGLNSGEVVVRSIGSDLQMDYSAIGQTVHLAARMEQIAAAGSVLITGDTLRLAGGYVQVKPLGAVRVKGLSTGVDAYELAGAVPTRTRFQVTAARGLTRFIGRDAELETLWQALSRAGAGHGEVFALVGEPGVGKSRLVWEFTHSHRTHGWLALEGGSVSYDKATAYRPIIELLKGYFQIEDRDDGGRIREKVTDKLFRLNRTLESSLPAILSLLDVPVEDPEWLALDPPQRRQRTLEACKRLLLTESEVQPLLLVFEDLQWSDTDTLAFLDDLVASLSGVRLLVIVNYRPEYNQRWAGKTYCTQVRIDPLAPGSAEELLGALVGDAALPPLRPLLIGRTAGNPFFLEESVRTLVETGVLVGERGAFRLAMPVESIKVPPTVQAVLAARIDRLPPEDKQLLQTAAVVGQDVPFPLLQAVCGGSDEDALREGLANLLAADLLDETTLFPDLEYTFRHMLTHEVAYGSLLLARRRTLHAEIVDAIERLYRDRQAEHVESLAYHALRGDVWDKAVVYLRQAGAKAVSRSAYREALMFLKQALSASGHLESARARLTHGVDLRFEIRNALWALGELGQGLDYLRQAEPLAAELSDQRRLARLAAHKSSNYLVLGDNERALHSGEHALAIAKALGDFALQVDANQFLGVLYTSLGDYRRAMGFLEWNVAQLVGDRCRGRFGEYYAVHTRTWFVWSLVELGQFDDATVHAEAAIRIAEEGNHAHNVVAANWALGYLHRTRGDLKTAIPALERSLSLCQSASIAVWFRPSAALLGHAYALSGRVPEALVLLEQAVKPGENNVALSFWEAHLAEAYILAGRLDEAADVARHSLNLARDRREMGFEAHSLRVIAEIAARRGQPEDAEEQYRAALMLATERGMRPLAACCHVGLGMLCRRAAKVDLADRHLEAVRELCRQMNIQPSDVRKGILSW